MMNEQKVEEIVKQVISGLSVRVVVFKEYSNLKVEVRLLNFQGDTIAVDSDTMPIKELLV